MGVFSKNIFLCLWITSSISVIWLGKKYQDNKGIINNSEKFQLLVNTGNTSAAYDLLFVNDFYNKLYKFFLISEIIHRDVKISDSYQQFFHREINRHLNYRSLMTILCVSNDSDLCDEGWVSRWGSPWLTSLEFAKFISRKNSKIFPHITKFDLPIEDLKIIIDDHKCKKIK